MARPREWDRDKVADDLVAWAQLDDSINLCGFCAIYMIPPSKVSQWALECDKFRQAYEIAKVMVGARREQKLSKNELHTKAYDLNAAVYDYYLKKERQDQARYELELAKEKAEHQQKLDEQTTETVSQELKDHLSATMSQLKSLQQQSQALSIDDSNSNKAK